MIVLCGMPTIHSYVHSTRPKIQGLVSRDFDRQFVTAWVRQWVTNIRFMCRALPSTVVRRRRKFWVGFLYDQGNDYELIPTIKMKTRLPVEGSFGNKFPWIYNHCVVMAAWSRNTLKKISNFFTFVGKRPLTVQRIAMKFGNDAL